MIVALLTAAGLVFAGQESPGVEARAIQNAPLDAATRGALMAALQTRDYKRAEKLLVKAIEQNPKAASLLTLAAAVFFQDGEYMNAAIAMKKAEKLAPLDDANRFTLAMSYVRLKHPDWARSELEKLAKSDPRNPLYPYWLARLDYDDQMFAAAVEKLNRAIELNPEYMKAYDNLALSLEGLGKLDEAVRAYEKANELNSRQKPGSPWPPLNFGILLTRMGRYDEAERYLRESAGYDGRFAQAHYRLGVVLEKKSKLPEAVVELRQATALSPEYAEPWYALGRIYQQQGDAENAAKALAEFRKFKERSRPSSPAIPDTTK
jgi:tetratricopeptide (TPR) repeat protein